MEDLSRNTIPPRLEGKGITERWFYERSRGQYLNEQSDLTPAQKREYKQYYPKDKLITKTDLALVLNSWGLYLILSAELRQTLSLQINLLNGKSLSPKSIYNTLKKALQKL